MTTISTTIILTTRMVRSWSKAVRATVTASE